MKVLGQTLALLLGLAVLASLGFGGYRAVNYIADLFRSLDFQVARITAITSVVALLGSIIIARSILASGKQNQTTLLVEERAKTYRLLINIWCGLVDHGRAANDRTGSRLPDEQRTLDRLLALHGSPGVIKAHISLRALEQDRGTHSPDVKLQFARALMEMRKDLGAQTVGLTSGDIEQLLFAESGKAGASVNAITNGHRDRQLLVAVTSES